MTILARPLRAALAAAAASVLFVPAAIADDAASYFKGKTINFVVGFGAGGGYDAYSRMLAPHYERILGASVVVSNAPGAGGMNTLNRFYLKPGDGLNMTIVNGTGASLQQMLLPAAKFDLTRLGYLGIVDYARWIWLVAPNSPINTPDDALKTKKVLHWGGSGKISGISDGAAFTCFTLKLNCRIVAGYKGSRAAALALAQGEMDALYVSETSAFNYVRAKNAKPIATMNRERSILFPNLPTIFETTKLDADQQWWLDYRATIEKLGRILVVPPNTRPDLLKVLQDATRKILTDPTIIAEADKKKRYIKYVDPAEAKQLVAQVLDDVTPVQRAQIKKVVLGE